jgi:hypothetical protein
MRPSVIPGMLISATAVSRIVCGNQSERLQEIQRAVNRCTIRTRIGSVDQVQDLRGRDRLATLMDDLKDRPSLAGHSQTAITHGGLKVEMAGHGSPYCYYLQ